MSPALFFTVMQQYPAFAWVSFRAENGSSSQPVRMHPACINHLSLVMATKLGSITQNTNSLFFTEV
jgi:hypothetical protein